MRRRYDRLPLQGFTLAEAFGFERLWQDLFLRSLYRRSACQSMGALAMKEHQVNQKHGDQHRAEGANDSGAGGKIEQYGEVNSESRNQRAHRPTNRQATTDPVREEHRTN